MHSQQTIKSLPSFDGELVLTKSAADFNQHFTDVDLFSMNVPSLDRYMSIGQNEKSFNLNIGNIYEWEITLYGDDIRADNYIATAVTDNGIIEIPRGKNTTYTGYINDIEDSKIRLTIDGNFIYGYIDDGVELQFIEPAQPFTKNKAKDQYVIYKESDVVPNKNAICGVNELHKIKSKKEGQLKNAGTCANVDLAVASDYSYYQAHNNSSSEVIQQTLAIMNLVNGDYSGNFTYDIDFNIVTNKIITSAGSDPFSSTLDMGTLLTEFRSWAPTANGFGAIAHDLGQLWTDRGSNSGVIGVAYVGAVCLNGWKYHVLKEFSSNQAYLRNLVSHEIGHNFGSSHDGQGTSQMMAPSIPNPPATSWSSSSISQVNMFMASNTFNCSSACIPDCPTASLELELVSATVSGCQPGNTATYTATFVISHNGGDQNGFNINIGGENYFTSFSSSPQTVNIGNLPANGASNIPIIVSSVTSSLAACHATGTINAPSDICNSAISEDFNTCSIPAGWQVSSTNSSTFTINGIHVTKWQWDVDGSNRYINSYGANSNASTTKTIDGSCMAFMDDDLANFAPFTGTTTLTTESYNISDLENAVLSFDYNFNNAGVTASNLKVDIFNGSTWVNILTDNSDACPWNNNWQAQCNTAFSHNLSGISATNFRVRFVFTDGNSGAWAGMVAVDNFAISGDVGGGNIGSGGGDDCNNTETVSSAATGMVEARSSITTQGNITVGTDVTFNAPSVTLNAGFSISAGAVFEVQSTGCN